jgi:chromosome segregation ATPase
MLDLRKAAETGTAPSKADSALNRISCKLKGIHGRFSELVRVKREYAEAVLAVNAVVERAASSSVVVDSKRIALQVISHFRQNCVGRISCDILEELRKPQRSPCSQAGVPLVSIVECRRSDYDRVAAKYLSNWLLIPTRREASALRQSREGSAWNIVTTQGECFLRNGEIFTTRTSSSSRYAVGLDFKSISLCRAASEDPFQGKFEEQVSMQEKKVSKCVTLCDNLQMTLRMKERELKAKSKSIDQVGDLLSYILSNCFYLQLVSSLSQLKCARGCSEKALPQVELKRKDVEFALVELGEKTTTTDIAALVEQLTTIQQQKMKKDVLAAAAEDLSPEISNELISLKQRHAGAKCKIRDLGRDKLLSMV